jgi:hypothetical protein
MNSLAYEAQLVTILQRILHQLRSNVFLGYFEFPLAAWFDL